MSEPSSLLFMCTVTNTIFTVFFSNARILYKLTSACCWFWGSPTLSKHVCIAAPFPITLFRNESWSLALSQQSPLPEWAASAVQRAEDDKLWCLWSAIWWQSSSGLVSASSWVHAEKIETGMVCLAVAHIYSVCCFMSSHLGFMQKNIVTGMVCLAVAHIYSVCCFMSCHLGFMQKRIATGMVCLAVAHIYSVCCFMSKQHTSCISGTDLLR